MTESARCWLQQRQPGHTLRGSHELSPTTAREERPVEFSYRLISPLFDPDGLVTVADTPPPIDAQPEVRTDSTTTCVHTRTGTRDGRVTATGRLALAAH